MKKISELTNKDVIHCPTEEEAKAILKLADEAGYKWSTGDSYLTETEWDICEKDTCYLVKEGQYCSLDWYKETGYTIRKASEFLETKRKFKIGDKVVPISKSKGTMSSYITKGLKKQGYLYVTRLERDTSSYGHIDYTCNIIESGSGDFFMESDLIPYVEEFVLPEKWKVAVKENLKFFNDLGRNLSTTACCGYITSNPYLWKYPTWGYWMDSESCEDYQEITFEQFKKYVLKQDNMKEIIGYKCPQQLFGSDIFEGEIFTKVPRRAIYTCKGHSNTEYKLPAEIVETWEPVYKQDEYKIGDWVYWSGNNPTFAKINSEIGTDNCYKLDVDGNISSHNNCHKSNLRKATQEEIQNHLVSLAKEKVVSVGGKFDVKIKDGEIYHKSDNITTFVKELINFFSFDDDEFGGYKAIVKDIVFSKTGCQNVETKLSDWKEVMDEYNKLQK